MGILEWLLAGSGSFIVTFLVKLLLGIWESYQAKQEAIERGRQEVRDQAKREQDLAKIQADAVRDDIGRTDWDRAVDRL